MPESKLDKLKEIAADKQAKLTAYKAAYTEYLVASQDAAQGKPEGSTEALRYQRISKAHHELWRLIGMTPESPLGPEGTQLRLLSLEAIVYTSIMEIEELRAKLAEKEND